jgi:hypothetical protein
MRIFAVALVVCLSPVYAAGPSEVSGLIDLARSAPPEFSADAMIRIATSNQIEKNRKVALLEEAFQAASSAQQAYKRHAALARSAGPVRFLNSAYAQNLDALSLRLRALELLLPLDPRKAKELFAGMAQPSIPKLTCEDFLVYDVSRYYEMAGQVMRQGLFTDREKQAGEPYRLVERSVGGITSPVQVGPAARLLLTAALSNQDFQSALTAFSGALAQISGDDRSFATVESEGGTDIESLVTAAKNRNISPQPLLAAYRQYLVSNLTGERCKDDDQVKNVGTSFGVSDPSAAQQKPDAVQFFNLRLRIDPLQPIREEEATPKRWEGVAKTEKSCAGTACQAIASQYRNLIFGAQGVALSAADRAKPEWQTRLSELLSAMSDWKQSPDETPGAYFRDKCGIYSDLFSVAATPEDRVRVLRASLSFLQENTFQADNREEWLLPVTRLVGLIGLDPTGLGKLGEEMRHSGDIAVALYAGLEAAVPRSPDAILPLL